MQLSGWMEAHPRRARTIGVRYALVRRCADQWNLGSLAWLYMQGYLPRVCAACGLASTLYAMYTLRSKATLPLWSLAVGMGCPLAAHWALTSHYAHAQHAWTAHELGLQDAPLLPRAAPHDVVAVLAGTVWALPVWQAMCATTENWALPVRA